MPYPEVYFIQNVLDRINSKENIFQMYTIQNMLVRKYSIINDQCD